MKLDFKDRKILYLLEKNARMTNSEIAKAVLLSKDAVGYRIKNLEEKEIIRGYRAVVDLQVLGYSLFRVYFRLMDITQRELSEIVQFLKTEDKAWWIARLDGSWDFAFGFWAKNNKEFYDFYFRLSKKFRKFIKEKMISPILYYKEFPRRYLINSEELVVFKFEQVSQSKVVDDIDKNILFVLSKDARESLVQIAKNLGVDAKTIHNRIKKLEQEKVITGYKVDLDVSKLNKDFYTVEIDLNDFSRFKELEQSISSLKEFTGRSISIQGYDLEFDIEVENSQDFYRIVDDLRGRFKEIREVRFFRVLKNYKLIYVPEKI
ncbi:MAG: Lrp/AsnC family transcriptional regulator [Candidatus Nanoarchaeia archaeon]